MIKDRDGLTSTKRNFVLSSLLKLVLSLSIISSVGVANGQFDSDSDSGSDDEITLPPTQQENRKTPKKNKKGKKASIDFEDQLVEGEVKKPELFYLLQKKQFNYEKLIRLRKNFIPEMVKSAEDISILVDEDMELDN